MNKLVSTPKGMLLLTDQKIPHSDAREMAEQLSVLTGWQWVVLAETEYDEVASKYSILGLKTAEILKKFDL